MEADASEKLMIEDRRGVGNFQVDSLSFKVVMAPYLGSDKIKVDVISLNLQFDSEPIMNLRTSPNSDAKSHDSTAFKESI
jgi:hypothetical protein